MDDHVCLGIEDPEDSVLVEMLCTVAVWDRDRSDIPVSGSRKMQSCRWEQWQRAEVGPQQKAAALLWSCLL